MYGTVVFITLSLSSTFHRDICINISKCICVYRIPFEHISIYGARLIAMGVDCSRFVEHSGSELALAASRLEAFEFYASRHYHGEQDRRSMPAP